MSHPKPILRRVTNDQDLAQKPVNNNGAAGTEQQGLVRQVPSLLQM
jgi:hypothetical protein